MAQYHDQITGSFSENSRSTTGSTVLQRLPVVSLFYRILKDWQSEFVPRRYDNQYALTSLEWHDSENQARKPRKH